MESSFQRIFAATLALILFSGAGCSAPSAPGNAAESQMAKSTIQDVLKKNTDSLLSIPGVQGVAVGESGGKPCILVLVNQKTPEIMTKIPSQLEGFPVVVEETGTIRPLGGRAATRQR
jgi:hypothetical protein